MRTFILGDGGSCSFSPTARLQSTLRNPNEACMLGNAEFVLRCHFGQTLRYHPSVHRITMLLIGSRWIKQIFSKDLDLKSSVSWIVLRKWNRDRFVWILNPLAGFFHLLYLSENKLHRTIYSSHGSSPSP